jgi:glycosyltransferase involved in cell wall biosynthesis
MPVYNGARTIERAVKSVQNQTFSEWELLCTDDCSTDCSLELLSTFSTQDDRIRVLQARRNQGPAAARNLALRHARAKFVAYLDCDDELYPDYLQHVVRFQTKGDVLVFRYDRETSSGELVVCDPAQHRDHLFMLNTLATLGVAHRRELIGIAGEFDERPWFQEDWDLWKRLARTGASFLFVPFKSGLNHYMKTSLTRSPRLTDQHRGQFDESRQLPGSLFRGDPGPHSGAKIEKVLFAAPNSMIDPSSGAAIATDDAMQLLSSSGFQCQAFGATMLDSREEVCIEQTLADSGLPYEIKMVTVGAARAKMLFTRKGNVPVTLFRNILTQCGPTTPEVGAFLTAYERFLEKNRPDAVLTFGGGFLGTMMGALAKRRDIPIVFGLHNFAYKNVWDFRHADYVIVPSRFSKDYYWNRLGLHCQVLPNAIDFSRVKVDKRSGKYLTFVNPQRTKGLFVVARIAEQIARRRPDIPILVVESRSRAQALEKTGVDLSWARNLFGMTNTIDPRQFYAVSKVMLMPSLCKESFGLVAAEAMINGIPVLASNRGALPEVVGDGGLLFDIPARYTERTRDVPTAEEVEPWVENIIRLWDDEEFYQQQSQKALRHAERWHPDKIRLRYVDFFRNLHPQPGPPIVLKETGSSD